MIGFQTPESLLIKLKLLCLNAFAEIEFLIVAIKAWKPAIHTELVLNFCKRTGNNLIVLDEDIRVKQELIKATTLDI